MIFLDSEGVRDANSAPGRCYSNCYSNAADSNGPSGLQRRTVSRNSTPAVPSDSSGTGHHLAKASVDRNNTSNGSRPPLQG
jgi:hypothetical protein